MVDAMSEKTVVARFYRLANVREPVRERLAELSRENRRLTGRDIMRVEFGAMRFASVRADHELSRAS